MKKRILVMLLVVTLVFAYMPILTYAGETTEYAGSGTDVAADKSLIGTSDDAMTVAFDKSLDILALGDSISAGYGLDAMDTTAEAKDLYGGLKYLPKGVLSDVVRATAATVYGEKNVSLASGAVCIARTQDMCTLIDDGSMVGEPGKYNPDWYFNGLVKDYVLGGVTDTYTYGTENTFNITIARNVYREKIENSDLITLSCGGNNCYSHILLGTYYKDSSDFDNDLEDYYDSETVKKFNIAKQIVVAEAKLVDWYKAKNTEETAENAEQTKDTSADVVAKVYTGSGQSYSIEEMASNLNLDFSSAEKVAKTLFDLIEVTMYTLAADEEALADLLSMINQVNPDAKVVVLSLPYIFNDYKLKVSDELTIDFSTVLKPLIDNINSKKKATVEENSSFARYIDITKAELIPIEEFSDKVVELTEISTLLAHIEAVHPTLAGHKYIGEQILKEVNFTDTGDYTTTFKERINTFFKKLFSWNIFSWLKNESGENDGGLLSKLFTGNGLFAS